MHLPSIHVFEDGPLSA